MRHDRILAYKDVHNFFLRQPKFVSTYDAVQQLKDDMWADLTKEERVSIQESVDGPWLS